MHLMFGSVASAPEDAPFSFELFRRGVEKTFNVKAAGFGRGAVRTGISGQGRLAGNARDDESYLIYLGAIHKPLPDWETGSPLDDPDKTAAFLLRRYIKQGIRFLDGIIGSYIVALWDERNQRFVLANDPRGMRTAFYINSRKGLFFSSTLYALNCAVEQGLEIDRSLEDFLLGYEFLPWQQTVYKSVSSLAPGTILIWENGAIQQHSSRQTDYSDYRLENLLGTDVEPKQVRKTLHDLFMRCLEDMLSSDENVAVLLGGFDSALVAAACHKLGKVVDTYTFHFQEQHFNQAYAEETAQLCNGRHHWIDITPELLQNDLLQYPLIFNQPSGMPHYLLETAHVLHQMQVDGQYHCVTGDGCDEIFLGYPSVFKRAQFIEKLHTMPSWFSRSLMNIFKSRLVENFLGQPARFIRNFITVAERPMPRRGHISNRILDKYSLYHLRMDTPAQALDTETILASLSLGLEEMSPLRLAYHGKSMPGLNREKNTGASAASGMTMLSPFQHPHLVAFAQSLPVEMLRSDFGTKGTATGKEILMRTAEDKGLLPHDIIYQKKASPVAGMADFWYMGPLKGLLLKQIDLLPFDYDELYVRKLLDFKLAEELFRKKLSLGSYVLTAATLLATYASYNDPTRTLTRGLPG